MTNLLGIAGLAGAGKNALADAIKELVPGAVDIALAEPIKRFCKEIFAFTDEQINGAEKEAIDPRYVVSPRTCLQTLGTEWGRAMYEDVWIDAGIRRAKSLLTPPRYDAYCFGGEPEVAASMVLISDCRFPNEAAAIHREGGVIVRVVRPGIQQGSHASEQGDFPVDYTIINDGSLEDLKRKAEEWLRSTECRCLVSGPR